MLRDGKVLVSGGPSTDDFRAEVYDPASHSWTLTALPAHSRYAHTATRLPDGKVLVVGGFGIGSDDAHASSELYDPATRTWSLVGSLSQARAYHTATLLPDGKVLVVGGKDSASGGMLIALCEVYDPATHVWSAAGSLTEAREGHTATLLRNGKVLIVGGNANTHEVYDPALGASYRTGPSLHRSRLGHTATLLPQSHRKDSDTVLVIGGRSASGGLTGGSEVYDLATNTWAAAGSLTEERFEHTATLLPNGTVLIVGGRGSPPTAESLSSSEVYEPVTRDWLAGARLVQARHGHSATLLESGQVLVAGGATLLDGSVDYASRVELFTPRALMTSLSARPASVSNQATASFTFSANGSGVHFVCGLDEAAFAPCASPFTTPPLAEGAHTFRVQARDAAGNVDDTPETHAWSVDTVAPREPVLQEPAPGEELFTAHPLFSGLAEPDSTVTLLVDGVGVGSVQADGQGRWSLAPDSALAWGAHRASARATDGAGNPGPLLPEVAFSTSQRGNYRMGCAALPSHWRASWPWALVLLGLLRERSRRLPRAGAPSRGL